MTRSFMLTAVIVAVVGLGRPEVTVAQQVAVPSGQPARVVQPTRSYRSYSVNPANRSRGEVRRVGPHSNEATWRHAGAKPYGDYRSGR
jgi:hypothetical protein